MLLVELMEEGLKVFDKVQFEVKSRVRHVLNQFQLAV